jgi:hypothetical protein
VNPGHIWSSYLENHLPGTIFEDHHDGHQKLILPFLLLLLLLKLQLID